MHRQHPPRIARAGLRRCALWSLAVALMLGGCAPVGVLSRLPDPVFIAEQDPARYSVSRFSPPAARVNAAATASRPARVPTNWHPPGGVSQRWACIVIHHSASDTGGARTFDYYHRNVRHWDELGYHFVIGNGSDTPDGCIEVGSRWLKQKHGAHCKTPDNFYNDHGIGICLVGHFDHHPPSAAQLESLERLLRFLMAECDIPLSEVRTHGGITHRTACPGSMFPIGRVKARLDTILTAGSHAR